MNNYPLVSIVMPAYNHEDFVANALDSVLRETYPNKEIVILNDGSKDNTEAVIHEWIEKNKDKISVVFKSRENKGLCKTLNELLQMVNGEYIVGLASDDELRNDGILKRFECLQKNPDKKAVLADNNVIDNDGNLLYTSFLTELALADKEKFKTDKDFRREIVANFRFLGSVFMVKKEVYEEVGNYDETICLEDRDFYLRLAAKNYLMYLDEVVAGYRMHDTNTTRTKALIKVQADTRIVLMKYFDTFKEYRVDIIKEIIYATTHEKYLRFKYYLEEKLNQEKPPLIFKIIHYVLSRTKSAISDILCIILGRKV